MNKIDEEVLVNNQVRDILDEINDNTKTAVQRIKVLYSLVVDQKSTSKQVREDMKVLESSSESVQLQLQGQSSKNKVMEQILQNLNVSTGQVIHAVEAIENESRNLESKVVLIKDLSKENSENILSLENLVNKEKE